MTAQHTKHAKHTKRKRRRRSPLRILIILILVIAVLVGLTLSTVHKKAWENYQQKGLDHSQLVTVNKDSNMTDYTNYAFSELILRLEVCQIVETVLILS